MKYLVLSFLRLYKTALSPFCRPHVALRRVVRLMQSRQSKNTAQ